MLRLGHLVLTSAKAACSCTVCLHVISKEINTAEAPLLE